MTDFDAGKTTMRITPAVVVARYREDGAEVLDTDSPLTAFTTDLSGAVSVWQSDALASVPDRVGHPSPDTSFAAAGSVKFGRAWIAPGTVGALDFTGMTSGPVVAGSDPSFHRTDTLDLGVVEEGEAELHLENGQIARLSPGSCFVLTGQQHRWNVLGDDPFVFTVFTVGAERGA